MLQDSFDSYTDVSHSTTGLPYEAVIFYVICLILNTFILSKGIKLSCKVGMPLLIFLSCIGSKRIDTWTWSIRNFPDANAWDGLNFL
jgi:SNF family Na+-dependent transporter